MHEPIFAEAAQPWPVDCLRQGLRVYSVGHDLLLIRQQNPLVCLTEEGFNSLPESEQVRSLRRAVLICGNDWESNQRGSYFSRLALVDSLLTRLWVAWCNRFCQYPLELANFRNYLHAAHATFPAPEVKADEICAGKYGYEPMGALRGRIYGGPHLARLINFIAPRLNSLFPGVKTVFDAPYALANHLFLAHLESEGAARIENHQEHEEFVEYERIVAETRAEEEAEAELQRAELDKSPGLASPPPNL